MLTAQGQTLINAQPLLPSVTIDHEQRVHARDQLDRLGIFGIYLHRIDKLAARVRPTSDMYQLLSADIVIGLIAVGLENPVPLTQELPRALAPAAQLKLEHRFAARLAVLPQVGLMIGAAAVVHLNGHSGFVGL